MTEKDKAAEDKDAVKEPQETKEKKKLKHPRIVICGAVAAAVVLILIIAYIALYISLAPPVPDEEIEREIAELIGEWNAAYRTANNKEIQYRDILESIGSTINANEDLLSLVEGTDLYAGWDTENEENYRLFAPIEGDIAELVEVAATDAPCVFGYNPEGGFTLLLPWINHARPTTRSLRLAIEKAIAEGDNSKAVEYSLAAIRIGRDLANKGPLIAAIVGRLAATAGWEGVPGVVSSGVLDESEILALIEELARIRHSFPGAAECLKWEKAFGIIALSYPDEIRRNIDYISSQKSRKLAIRFMPDRWHYYQRANLKLSLDEVIAALNVTEDPDYILRAKKLAQSQCAELGDDGWRMTLIYMIYPSVERTVEMEGKTVVRFDGCFTACYLEIYRHRYKTYPESLKAVENELAITTGSDPFSGKPYIYKKTSDGYLFYSIGPNGADDGGKTEDDDKENYDIIFRGGEE